MTLIIESFYFLSLVLLCFKQCKFLIKRIWILFQFPMQTSIIIKPLISNACPFAIPLMLIHLDHSKFQSQHFEVDLLDLGCVKSSHVQVCNWVAFLLLWEKQVLWRLNTIVTGQDRRHNCHNGCHVFWWHVWGHTCKFNMSPGNMC